MPTLAERAQIIADAARSVPAVRLTLAQFAGSGRQVVIYSDVLECEVVLAADNARVLTTETRPVYRARELAALWGEDGRISAEGLRLLHETKTRFGGEIQEEPAAMAMRLELFGDK